MESILGAGTIPGLTVEQVERDNEYILAIEHFHSYHELYYLHQGHRTFFIQDKVFEVFAGSMVVIPAGQIHKIGPNENSAHMRTLFRIDTSLLEQMHGYLGEPALLDFFANYGGVLLLLPQDSNALEAIMSTLLEEFLQGKNMHQASIKIQLASLLLFLLRRSHAQSVAPTVSFTPPKLQKVQEVAEYLSAHYTEDIALGHLAQRFYISPYYLCRIFKEITGFTVLEYLHSNRIVHAQRLLLRTAYTVTQIAGEVGYNSTTQLNRKFKQIVGQTPLEYKNNQEKLG